MTKDLQTFVCSLFYHKLVLIPVFILLQTDQMGRIVNELDTIQFSIKKASQLVKEIGRQVAIYSPTADRIFLICIFINKLTYIRFQVATDKCIMLFLFLIVCGVIAVIVVKVNSIHLLVTYVDLMSILFCCVKHCIVRMCQAFYCKGLECT